MSMSTTVIFTVMQAIGLYVSVSIASIVVFLVLGSSVRDVPEEVFWLGFIWPVSIPLFIYDRITYQLNGETA